MTCCDVENNRSRNIVPKISVTVRSSVRPSPLSPPALADSSAARSRRFVSFRRTKQQRDREGKKKKGKGERESEIAKYPNDTLRVVPPVVRGSLSSLTDRERSPSSTRFANPVGSASQEPRGFQSPNSRWPLDSRPRPRQGLAPSPRSFRRANSISRLVPARRSRRSRSR